jgi:hypothetical protein
MVTTMDIERHRRQAAWLCFSPYLSEEQLLKAIQILEQGFQSEGTVNLIAYVAKICMEFGLDLQNHKRLYGVLHDLTTKTTEFNIDDPLFLLTIPELPQRDLPKPSENLKRDLPKPPENLITKAVNALPTQPMVSFHEDGRLNIPAYTQVFIDLMRQIFEYTSDKAAVLLLLRELANDKKLQSQDLSGHIEQWVSNPSNFYWAQHLDVATLTRIVHLVYTALCEHLGPVSADDCFHKALAICERKPEARLFSPSQFL